MRRFWIIGCFAAMFLAVLVYFWVRSERDLQQKIQQARAVSTGLNLQFLSDPRFRNLRANGYHPEGKSLLGRGTFEVAGFVWSTNDLQQARKLVEALNPPGSLEFKVAVQKPPTVVQPTPKTVISTNKLP